MTINVKAFVFFSGRHLGFLVDDKLLLNAAFRSRTIFRKSHKSTPLYLSGFQRYADESGLGVILPPPPLDIGGLYIAAGKCPRYVKVYTGKCPTLAPNRLWQRILFKTAVLVYKCRLWALDAPPYLSALLHANLITRRSVPSTLCCIWTNSCSMHARRHEH